MADQPERVGDYLIEGKLGEGGMATVFRGRHVVLDTLHAVKVLDPRHRADAGTRQRFLDEAKIQAKHLRHPNIVKVTNAIASTEHAALVMELIEGGTLDDLVGRVSDEPRTIRRVMRAVLAAVGHAHAAGIVHRDLKPGNVLLDEEDGEVVPKVTDFGIAKVSAELAGHGKKSTQGSARMGTLHYMSPEQLRSPKDVTARSDIFSLGVMLYELATGASPFEGDTDYTVMENIVHGRYVAPEYRCPSIDPHFAATIRRALDPDPARRFASCEEMADALGTDVTQAPLPSTAPPPPPSPPPPREPVVAVSGYRTDPDEPVPRAQVRSSSSRSGGAFVVALLLLVGAGAVGVLLGRKGEDPVEVTVAQMGKLADNLCACKDMRCAEAVMKQMAALKEPSDKPTRAQMEKAMRIAEKMAECQKKIMSAEMPPPPPPVPAEAPP